MHRWARVFSAFTLAYALFEIPAGYLGDRIGPRKVLLRIVLWWSFFTVATGWMWSWASLIVTRFLFGAGEAGAFPNLTKAFNRWLPQHERTKAQGMMWMSARLGGAFTPLLVYGCLQWVNWRSAFLLFGLVGVVWAILFFWWYRDDPRTHSQVNAAEAALLPCEAPIGEQFAIPWKKLFTSRTVWCLCGQYFACSYSFYFFITWFPTYLLKARGFDLKQSALAGWGALVCRGARIVFCRLAHPDSGPVVGRCRQGPAGCRSRRRRRRSRTAGGRELDRQSLPGRGRHRPGRLLQRYPDARRLDRLHGRRGQIGRHALGHYEHDG